mgnify:CR=1 FL=1
MASPFKSPKMEAALSEAASIMAKAAASEPSAAMVSELEGIHALEGEGVRQSTEANVKLDALVKLLAQTNALLQQQNEKQAEMAARAKHDSKIIRLQNARQLLKSHWRNDPPRLDNQMGIHPALARLHEGCTFFTDPYSPRKGYGALQPSEVLQAATDSVLQCWMKGYGKHVHRYSKEELKLLQDILEAVCGSRGVTRFTDEGEGRQLCLFFE